MPSKPTLPFRAIRVVFFVSFLFFLLGLGRSACLHWMIDPAISIRSRTGKYWSRSMAYELGMITPQDIHVLCILRIPPSHRQETAGFSLIQSEE